MSDILTETTKAELAALRLEEAENQKLWKASNKVFVDYLNVYNKASAELSKAQKHFLEDVFDAGALSNLQNEQRKFDAVNNVYLGLAAERRALQEADLIRLKKIANCLYDLRAIERVAELTL